MTGYGAIGDIGLGLYASEYSIEFGDDFTHIVGAHTIMAGSMKAASRRTLGEEDLRQSALGGLTDPGLATRVGRVRRIPTGMLLPTSC